LKTIVLGMGNPILSDDCVGLRVAQAVSAWLETAEGAPYRPIVTVEESSLAGFSLLDLLAGQERAIIVDSILTREGIPGSIYRLSTDDFNTTVRLRSPHDINLFTALELGRQMGVIMPSDVVILAIEAADTTTFGESCTPQVEEAIPKALAAVVEEVRR
jgi:hydrogenase maturation protease